MASNGRQHRKDKPRKICNVFLNVNSVLIRFSRVQQEKVKGLDCTELHTAVLSQGYTWKF